ncbi:tetratricopeptide repeat protein [Acinetobacter piscicola]|uniref:tetratricopeptide repeat protein n=1 Tax=Acinetobacter piscicola TaxID=2006115 RepID=UPI000B7D8CD0|nr:tetratricopeptide repeat protein [Acinetobacter piscicola]
MKMKLPLPKAPIKQQINKNNIAQLNQKLNQFSAQFKAATAQGNYLEAYQAVSQVVKLVPHHAVVMMDLAFTELRLQRYEDAYAHYQQAIQLNPNTIDTNIYDGLAEVCHFLNKPQELKKYGRLAVETKKQQVIDQPMVKQLSEQPSPFNAKNPAENIIAFSLFGENPRYCETSVINVDLAKEIYPDWICRFYVDDSVPENVVQRLHAKGAQIIIVNEQQRQISGLFWRFFVMDDPTVKRFLIRDADSLVSYREQAAINEWLKSDKWFHLMHDYYSHTELILAGMWGGCQGVLNGLEKQIQQFLNTGHYLNSRVADQHFLRFCIWPSLKQSVLNHDSYHFDENSVDFPQSNLHKDYETEQQFHVGMNEGSSKIVIHHLKDQPLYWAIYNEQQQQICHYLAKPTLGQLEIDIPRFYARQIEKQNWKVETHPLENID